MILEHYKSSFNNAVQIFSEFGNYFIDVDKDSCHYKIVEVVKAEPLKFRVRRKCSGMTKREKGLRLLDKNGKKIIVPFTKWEDAILHAEMYIKYNLK